MALWGGILTRLQSTTCKTLWGITKFSEDALGTLGQTVGGVESGIATVLNNTLTGNFGQGNLLNVGEVIKPDLPGLFAPENINKTAVIPAGSHHNNTHKLTSTADTLVPVTESTKQTTTKKKQPQLLPNIPPLMPKFPIGFKK